MVQVDGDAVEIVHPPGAHEARRISRPGRIWSGRLRIEHGVIDHELVASREKVAQGRLAALALELVTLLNELPGKVAALATQLVAQMRELFFFGEMLLASRHPLVV